MIDAHRYIQKYIADPTKAPEILIQISEDLLEYTRGPKNFEYKALCDAHDFISEKIRPITWTFQNEEVFQLF